MTENDDFTPEEWAQDSLSKFLEDGHYNCKATFQNHRVVFDILAEIDSVFCKVAELKMPAAMPLIPNFIARSHYSWQAAVRLVLSGQFIDAYSVMRVSLECSLYGHFIGDDTSLSETWIEGRSSGQAEKKLKRTFTAAKVKRVLKENDEALGQAAEILYDATIALGAHPNVEGHILAAEWQDDGVTVHNLAPGTPQWKKAMEHCRELGICVLQIFELTLEPKFDEAGLSLQLESPGNSFDNMW